jgi:hypothetical protein
VKYIYLVHDAPCFQEQADAWRVASQRRPSLIGTIPIDIFITNQEVLLRRKNTCYIAWGVHKVPPRQERESYVVGWYSETPGPPGSLIPAHAGWWNVYLERIQNMDATMVDGPATVEFMKKYVIAKPIIYSPTGYDMLSHGQPDWAAPKTSDLLIYATITGRRVWSLVPLMKRLGERHRFFDNTWLKERKKTLEASRATIYVGHSTAPGISSFRIWAMVGSSTAFIVEAGPENLRVEGMDQAWPMTAGRHYLQVPRAERENLEPFLAGVEEALADPCRMEEVARTANRELSRYTAEVCVEEFIEPQLRKAGVIP